MTIRQYFRTIFITALLNIMLRYVFNYESEHAMIISILAAYFIMLDFDISEIKKGIKS